MPTIKLERPNSTKIVIDSGGISGHQYKHNLGGWEKQWSYGDTMLINASWSDWTKRTSSSNTRSYKWKDVFSKGIWLININGDGDSYFAGVGIVPLIPGHSSGIPISYHNPGIDGTCADIVEVTLSNDNTNTATFTLPPINDQNGLWNEMRLSCVKIMEIG
jgi:hypothetical protein